MAARQVGFGSGFKCNSAVWKARRTIRDSRHAAWAHMVNGNLDCVWKYLEVRRLCARSGCRCMHWDRRVLWCLVMEPHEQEPIVMGAIVMLFVVVTVLTHSVDATLQCPTNGLFAQLNVLMGQLFRVVVRAACACAGQLDA